jgi:hypothetical protein
MVKIPIATPIYCDVPVLQQPPLAIAMLTADSAPADTIRMYVATVDILKSAVKERDTILKACAAPDCLSLSGRGRAKGAGEGPNSEMSSCTSTTSTSLRGPSAPQAMTQKNTPAPTTASSTFATALLSKLRVLLPW